MITYVISFFALQAFAKISECPGGKSKTKETVTIGHLRSTKAGIDHWIGLHQNNLDLFKEMYAQKSFKPIEYVHLTRDIGTDIAEYRSAMGEMKAQGVDVFFCPYSSGETTKCLIVGTELETPVVGFGSSGHGLYVNATTGKRRTPYFHCYNFWGRDTIAPFMGVFATEGVKTMTVFYEDNPYHVDNLYGMQQYVQAADNDLVISNEVVIDASADDLKSYLRSKLEDNPPSDAIVMLLYRQNCDAIQEILFDGSFYFKMIVIAATCGGAKFEDLKEKAAYVVGPIWWDKRLFGVTYSEDESCEACLFPARDGKSSAAIYAEEYNKRFDKDPHPIEACMMANFYKIHQAMIYALKCDIRFGEPVHLNEHLDRVTMGNSFYGPIGSSPYGHNYFAKPILAQYRKEGGWPQDIVFPASLSTAKMVYPMPDYGDRECFPDCEECPECIILNTIWLYIFFWTVIGGSLSCLFLIYYNFDYTDHDLKAFPWYVRAGFCASIYYSLFEIASGIISAINMQYISPAELGITKMAQDVFMVFNTIDCMVAFYSACVCSYGLYCVIWHKPSDYAEYTVSACSEYGNYAVGGLGVFVNSVLLVLTLFCVSNSRVELLSASSMVYDLCFSTGELILSSMNIYMTIEVVNGFEGVAKSTLVSSSQRKNFEKWEEWKKNQAADADKGDKNEEKEDQK